ncbi:MAG: hypothetical protein ABSE15_06035 [Candidatus Bathyarchaeia archaeon]|jgi:hypothetical protein
MQRWGLDSEFMQSGRLNEPADVHSIQISDGTPENTFFFDSADKFKQWLNGHHSICDLYGFVALPDLASVSVWLPPKAVKISMRGCQTYGKIKYGGFEAKMWDTRPLLVSLGIRKLAQAGEIVGFPKLEKPAYLGLRAPNCDAERLAFIDYANSDAIITSLITQWLWENFKADPKKHTSAGTLAKEAFQLPKRLERFGRDVFVPPLERVARNCCYAGRSEGFWTGYIPNTLYNDVKSLYPTDLALTHALDITGMRQCDIKLAERWLDHKQPINAFLDNVLESKPFGWVDGCFEVDNDLWGLPMRGNNVFYCQGKITGTWHSLDLVAAKAKPLYINHAWEPIFQPSWQHEKYVKMLMERLDGKISKVDSMYGKAILNALSGKLGQSHPIGATSNFFAYGTCLAGSHLIMSRLFDKCVGLGGKVYAMDTDSAFSDIDMAGHHWDLSDGEFNVPVVMDVKGKGALSFFRAKTYIMHDDGEADGKETVFGRHGWQYFVEDFLRCRLGGIDSLQTRKDIKHTLFTQQKKAKAMEIGRWLTEPVTLDRQKLCQLLRADPKRQRESRDSYTLVSEKKNQPSTSWTYEELLAQNDVSGLVFPKMMDNA